MPRSRGRRAVTLIELLVTIAISSILLAAVTYTFISFGKNTVVETSVSEVQMDVHSALAFVSDELRRARYIYNTDETSARPERLRLNPFEPLTETSSQDLSQAVFDKRQLVNSSSPGFRILLAFWVPTVMGTSRLLPNNRPAAQPGTPLAMASEQGKLVAWGSPASIPVYNLVVYYVTTPPEGSSWRGPRILERWESLPVAVRFDEFAEAEDPRRFLDPATYDLTAAPPVDGIFLRTLPAADESSFVLADFLDAGPGVHARFLSAQTMEISLRGSLEGSQADRALSADSVAQTRLRSVVGDALGYTTTVVARNVCIANGLCVKDP
jgi:prepilin-type N-terminal cleavage/methylation domain-containing protein